MCGAREFAQKSTVRNICFISAFFFSSLQTITPTIISELCHHTDSELLSLMRKGRREAFNEIYARYWEKVYQVAARRIRSREESKDLVQDLFFSLWVKRETLVINTSIDAYLFTAIKYKVINYIEANIVKEKYLKSLEQSVVDYDNSTHEQLIFQNLDELLQVGIKSLSPRVREVFELSRNEHLSINEIAERLQLSNQTVRNQISIALKTLRMQVYSGADKV